MTRIVYCDFCHAELTDEAYDCPARDFDYPEPRTGIDSGIVVDGSIGSWLACEDCAHAVREGYRETLLARAVVGNFGPSGRITDAQINDLRSLHDLFWEHREGPPVRIGAEQLALIASDPTIVKEPRDGP